MIFFSVALAGRFGAWCDIVIARLVEEALGTTEIIGADTLEQFVFGVIKAQTPNVVIASRQPLGSLWTALSQSNRPFTLAIDDPRFAMEHLVGRCGTEFVEATRIVAKSYASMASCALCRGAMGIRGDQARADPVAVAGEIARHLGLAVGDTVVAKIVETVMLDPGLSLTESGSHQWWDKIALSQRIIADGAIDPYNSFFDGKGLGPLTWERDLFFINEEDERHRQSASRPVDLTGRPRFVIDGPDITLPQGAWSANLALGFSEGAAELSYLVEVYAGAPLAQTRIEPTGRRIVEITLDFAIAEPRSIAIRVFNERAAFHGQLAVGHATIIAQGHVRPETRNYFATVLTE